MFDKRGTGMSDRVAGLPDLEPRMDDVRAAMDAAGPSGPQSSALSEGVPMTILFAATYSERCRALALCGGMARLLRAPDYPWGRTESEGRQGMTRLKSRWTTPGALEEICRVDAPNASDEEIGALPGLLRHGISPSAAETLSLMYMEIDVRKVLPSIRVPTLVLHRPLDTGVPIEHGR